MLTNYVVIAEQKKETKYWNIISYLNNKITLMEYTSRETWTVKMLINTNKEPSKGLKYITFRHKYIEFWHGYFWHFYTFVEYRKFIFFSAFHNGGDMAKQHFMCIVICYDIINYKFDILVLQDYS